MANPARCSGKWQSAGRFYFDPMDRVRRCNRPCRAAVWARRLFLPDAPVVDDNANRKEEPAMGRIVVTEFISLDGVIEDPGGSEGYKHGGWSFEISRGEEGDKFKLDEAMDSAALLLGRVTFEGF